MGAGVFTDPRYQALAARVAGALGGGASTTRAILAQWACEKSDGWPPAWNNPGNVHTAAMASVGVTGLAHGSGDGGAVAAFNSPEEGADAMVTLLTRAQRYRSAVASARANDGAGYLRGVTSAGWGTGYSCTIGYFNSSRQTGSGPVTPSSGSSGAPSPASSPSTTPLGTKSLAVFLGIAPGLWGAQLYHASADKIIGSGTRYVASGSPSDATSLLAYIATVAAVDPLAIAGLPEPAAIPGLGFVAGLFARTAGSVQIPVTADGHADMGTIIGSGNADPSLGLSPEAIAKAAADAVSGPIGAAGQAVADALGAIAPAVGGIVGGLAVNLAVLAVVLFLVFHGLRGLVEPA